MRKFIVMKNLITLIGILCWSSCLWSQSMNQPYQSSGYTSNNKDANGCNPKKYCYSCVGDLLKKNNGNLNLGFSNWNYAQTDKNAISTQNPWQLFNILSLYAGYENDNFYGYFLYTFNDNSVGQWLGYKFRIGNNGAGEKQAKKWDVYAVFTEYPSGALPYAGLGLEHTWDIQGPLSISYFVEGGVKDNFTYWSTGFILNCQQGILRKAKK